jgi:hypothetical protein
MHPELEEDSEEGQEDDLDLDEQHPFPSDEYMALADSLTQLHVANFAPARLAEAVAAAGERLHRTNVNCVVLAVLCPACHGCIALVNISAHHLPWMFHPPSGADIMYAMQTQSTSSRAAGAGAAKRGAAPDQGWRAALALRVAAVRAAAVLSAP